MYYEDDFNENLEVNATAILNYTIEIEDEEDEDNLEEVEREIEVSSKDLELVGSQDYDRKMGPEVCYNYTGTVEDENGYSIDVEMDVWEYPEGVLNHVEIKQV